VLKHDIECSLSFGPYAEPRPESRALFDWAAGLHSLGSSVTWTSPRTAVVRLTLEGSDQQAACDLATRMIRRRRTTPRSARTCRKTHSWSSATPS